MSITVKDYTSRVLGVIKEKYGLKDKAEAVDRLADMVGDEFVEREVSEDLIKELIQESNAYTRKQGFKGTSLKKLRKEIEG